MGCCGCCSSPPVAAEKLLPRGEWIARATGIALMLLGRGRRPTRPRHGAPSRQSLSGVSDARDQKRRNARWPTFSGRSAASTSRPAVAIPSARARPRGSRRGRPRGHCDAGLVFRVDRGQYGGTTARRPELRGPAAHAGPDDPGQLDGRPHPRRARVGGAARGAHHDRERPGWGPDGRGRPADRQLARRRGGADHDRDERHAPVGSIPGTLDIAIEGIAGATRTSRSTSTTSGIRPPRLALAKASRSHMHGFGIDWDDTSGRNNGHFAPFAWSSS